MFYFPFFSRDSIINDEGQGQEDVKKFAGEAGKSKREPIETDMQCPDCKKAKLAIRFGKSGEFLGCLDYPECKFTSNFERDEQGTIKLVEAKKPVLLEEKCPKCTKPLREIQGRFGAFKACSGYPACKYIHREVANFSCPQCKGEVVQKVWRGGKFWGCDNYPKCKFSVFDTVIDKKCPDCKWPFLTEKVTKEGSQTLCANKKCGYKK